MHFTGVYIKLKRSIYKNPLGKLTEKTAEWGELQLDGISRQAGKRFVKTLWISEAIRKD